jgi:hypothetical protein
LKQWTEATADGQCAYDKRHTWAKGARIFRVRFKDVKKAHDYCENCARQYQDAPPDTGEVLTIEDAVNYPTPLKALGEKLAEEIANTFDGRMAAAGKDED